MIILINIEDFIDNIKLTKFPEVFILLDLNQFTLHTAGGNHIVINYLKLLNSHQSS